MNLSKDEIAVIKKLLRLPTDTWCQMRGIDIEVFYMTNSQLNPSEDDCYLFAEKCLALGIGDPQ